jgi:hypothetical protein
MVDGTDLEKLMGFGFAGLVALILLRWLLGTFSAKLDCIKDAVIKILRILDERGE